MALLLYVSYHNLYPWEYQKTGEIRPSCLLLLLSLPRVGLPHREKKGKQQQKDYKVANLNYYTMVAVLVPCLFLFGCVSDVGWFIFTGVYFQYFLLTDTKRHHQDFFLAGGFVPSLISFPRRIFSLMALAFSDWQPLIV